MMASSSRYDLRSRVARVSVTEDSSGNVATEEDYEMLSFEETIPNKDTEVNVFSLGTSRNQIQFTATRTRPRGPASIPTGGQMTNFSITQTTYSKNESYEAGADQLLAAIWYQRLQEVVLLCLNKVKALLVNPWFWVMVLGAGYVLFFSMIAFCVVKSRYR